MPDNHHSSGIDSNWINKAEAGHAARQPGDFLTCMLLGIVHVGAQASDRPLQYGETSVIGAW
jgi:hypothetical protein